MFSATVCRMLLFTNVDTHICVIIVIILGEGVEGRMLNGPIAHLTSEFLLMPSCTGV